MHLKKKERFRRIGWGFFLFLVCTMITSRFALADISRPDMDKGPTPVRVRFFIIDVDEIHTAAQNFDANVYMEYRWRDSRLVNNSPTEVSQPMNQVWHPRAQLLNQQKSFPSFPDFVEISQDGEVVYRQRLWGTFSNPLDLLDFPFDTQNFLIQLIAVGYSSDEIEFLVDPDSMSGISRDLAVPDWEVLDWNAEPGSFEPSPGEQMVAGLTFSFVAKRKSGYFITKVIIPLILIVGMSWIVFWIDPKESGTQISVSVTTMLTLIAYRFAVGSFLPKISYLTRLDSFIFASTILVFTALIMVVITSSLARAGKLEKARAIDISARWLFPLMFAFASAETLVFRFWL